VRRAGRGDLGRIAPLFDAYRQFYGQPSDLEVSTRFLSERLDRDQSVVFVAEEKGRTVGFVQMYPLFSSISLGRVYVLNDLFVVPEARRNGVGAMLLDYARRWAEAEKAHYLTLSTAIDNPAQRLYEACGWRLDREFLYYELPLPVRSRPP
jgi:GNAT superfamily N-acetyltransferase